MRSVWLGGLFVTAVLARWLAAADHNIAEDPFVIVESAKHLLATGEYRIPSIGAASGQIGWSMPSWPAGFPLLLAALFKLFGASEATARATTIAVSSLLPPITACLAYALTNRQRVALFAGAVAALHPLAVAFGGQIFTNNLSVTLFAGWLTALVTATVDRERGTFVPIGEVVGTRWRRRTLVLAAFVFGLAVSVRDTDVLLAGPAVYVLYRTGLFTLRAFASGRRLLLTTAGVAVAAFALGWSPGWYFNLVNFGSPFVSAHYETNIRLSPAYLFGGADAFFGLPGFLVMASAIAVFQFPVLLAFAPRSVRGRSSAVAAMTGLIALPLLLVNGAFPVASTGAAPRYVLPLVPFASLFAADLFDRALALSRRRLTTLMTGAVLIWHAILFFPPPQLFEAWPRFVYLAHYSPVYVGRPYHNYPDHTNAMVRWVQANTPQDALVVTPSRAQHFFYYARRDVCVLDTLTPEDWARHVGVRPVYFVEDRDLALRPQTAQALGGTIQKVGLQLVEAGRVEVFTPEAGLVHMLAYQVKSMHAPAAHP